MGFALRLLRAARPEGIERPGRRAGRPRAGFISRKGRRRVAVKVFLAITNDIF